MYGKFLPQYLPHSRHPMTTGSLLTTLLSSCKNYLGFGFVCSWSNVLVFVWTNVVGICLCAEHCMDLVLGISMQPQQESGAHQSCPAHKKQSLNKDLPRRLPDVDHGPASCQYSKAELSALLALDTHRHRRDRVPGQHQVSILRELSPSRARPSR